MAWTLVMSSGVTASSIGRKWNVLTKLSRGIAVVAVKTAWARMMPGTIGSAMGSPLAALYGGGHSRTPYAHLPLPRYWTSALGRGLLEEPQGALGAVRRSPPASQAYATLLTHLVDTLGRPTQEPTRAAPVGRLLPLRVAVRRCCQMPDVGTFPCPVSGERTGSG